MWKTLAQWLAIWRRVAAMKTLLVMVATAALAGCGVEAVGTAATGAAIKKQELEQGQKTLQQAQQKIDAAAQQMQSRTADADK
jgi:hypothetical protein